MWEEITWRISDNEPFPREADVPVKSRTSSTNWNAKPYKHAKDRKSSYVELMTNIEKDDLGN